MNYDDGFAAVQVHGGYARIWGAPALDSIASSPGTTVDGTVPRGELAPVTGPEPRYSDAVSPIHFLTGQYGGFRGRRFFSETLSPNGAGSRNNSSKDIDRRVKEQLKMVATALRTPRSVYPGPRWSVRELQLNATVVLFEGTWCLKFTDFAEALPFIREKGTFGPDAPFANLVRDYDPEVPLWRQTFYVDYRRVCCRLWTTWRAKRIEEILEALTPQAYAVPKRRIFVKGHRLFSGSVYRVLATNDAHVILERKRGVSCKVDASDVKVYPCETDDPLYDEEDAEMKAICATFKSLLKQPGGQIATSDDERKLKQKIDAGLPWLPGSLIGPFDKDFRPWTAAQPLRYKVRFQLAIVLSHVKEALGKFAYDCLLDKIRQSASEFQPDQDMKRRMLELETTALSICSGSKKYKPMKCTGGVPPDGCIPAAAGQTVVDAILENLAEKKEREPSPAPVLSTFTAKPPVSARRPVLDRSKRSRFISFGE